MMRELRAFGRGQVWLALAIGAIGFGGLFAVYSYVAPIVMNVTRLPESVVPLVLVLVGIGMTIGNFVGGWGSDRNLRLSMYCFFTSLLVGLVGLALTAHTLVGLLVFVFIVAASCSALSPAIQTRIMDVARDSQSIAAALNHSALNIANALGAYLGGVTIAAGLGYLSPVWIGVVLGLAGVGLAVVSFRVERRSAGRAGVDEYRSTGPVERVPMLVD
jgi:DHA1 family inner membrane transport protein